MQTEDFVPIYDMIKVLDLDKKKKIKGLSASRADILPAALAVIKSFVTRINASNFTFSGAGLREGIMFNQALPTTIEKPISDVLGYSLTTLVKYYGCDVAHVERVTYLSIQLFKQLRVLHKFPRQHLKILKVAANLHDAGTKVQYYNYEKHSGYIIMNANIYGLSHKDTVLASFVAANSSIEDINMAEWVKYKELVGDEDMETVRKLGTILRIADALDRSMGAVVKGINCDILGDSVIMKTEVDGDASLEINSAYQIGADFRKIFKKNLEIL